MAAARWREENAEKRAAYNVGRRVAPKPKECVVCGELFTPQRSDCQVCSDICRWARDRRRVENVGGQVRVKEPAEGGREQEVAPRFDDPMDEG